MTGEAVMTPAARRHVGDLARGGALGMVGSVVAGAAGFALVVLVARSLDAAQAGVFFAVTAAFLLAEGLAVLGTDTGFARFLLRLEAAGSGASVVVVVRAARRLALRAAVGLALVAVVLAWPAGSALGWSVEVRSAVLWVAPALPAAVLCDVSLAATRAFGDIRSTVLVDKVLRAGAQPVLIGLALAAGGGLQGAALAWAATHVLAAVAAGWVLRVGLARRGLGMPPAPADSSGEVLRAFWSFTWLRALARVAQLSMQKVDIVLVALLLSPGAAAAYTVATRFVPLGQLLTQPIQQVLQPRLTAILVHEDPATVQQVHRVATAWSILLAWPLYLGVGALAMTYLALFGGEVSQVDHARTVVLVMAGAMLVAVATGPVDTLLLMAGRSGLSAVNSVLALVLDVLGCLVLVPVLGILGAALAWAGAVVTRCGLAVVQVWRDVGVHDWSGLTRTAALVPLLVVGLPAVLVSVLAPPPLVLWGAVVGIVLTYAVVVWTLREVWGLASIRAQAGRVRAGQVSA